MPRQLIDLEDLKAWRAARIRQGNCNYDDMTALNAFINTAEIVPDRPQEWIPCSERLPSENGYYLVTLENGVVKILGYSTTQRTTYPKGFYHIEDGFSWRQIQNPVVAWMPLPEAWKGADDDMH
jgi:hypothetical protein